MPISLTTPAQSSWKRLKALLSVLVPAVLVLAFAVRQWGNLDSSDWSSGFSHPLMGFDHLLTMLAVGIWAAQLRGHAIWQLPLTFVVVMSIGGFAGAAGVAMPVVEGLILLSCAVFSVLITRKIRFNNKINVLLVAFFAFFHGYAHGQEISASASLISYTLGFMLATLLLHGAGILVAKLVILAVGALFAMLVSTAAQASFPLGGEFATAKTALETNQKNLTVKFFQQFERQIVASPGAENGSIVDAIQNRQSTQSYVSNHQLLISHRHSRGSEHTDDVVVVHSDLHQIAAFRLFKAYFPDINQTPGQALSSNGVGLNSPPVLLLSIVVPASFSFRVIRQTFQVSPACCAVQFLKSVKALSIAINSASNLQFISNHLRISHVY